MQLLRHTLPRIEKTAFVLLVLSPEEVSQVKSPPFCAGTTLSALSCAPRMYTIQQRLTL